MSLIRRIQAARYAAQLKTSEAAALPAEPKARAARITRLTAESQNRNDRFEKEFGHDAVKNSADLERILALPRRAPIEEGTPESARLIEEMTARLSNGRKAGDGCKCHEIAPNQFDGTPGSACITKLWHIQAWYLHEAAQVGGILGPISVGAGKTGIDVLTAMVVPNCRQAVLLLPPTLKPQFLKDFARWSQHFHVPNIAGSDAPAAGFVTGLPVLHVLKYSELSSPGFSNWFAARPEISVVIADEAQALKDRNATRVKRFIAHFLDNPETRFFCHTGSLTSRGIEDYSHLCVLALREGSPVPIEPHVVTSWGEALNPTRYGDAAPPGALMRLCNKGESVQRGFARRLIETPGVIATFEGSLTGVKLIVRRRTPPPMPPEVHEALVRVRSKKIRPDGEELQDAMEVARCAREVACGFYLYWNFPGAAPEDFVEPAGRIPQWRAARQSWNREVRSELERYTPGMDSEGLLKEAARRHVDGYRGKKKPVWPSKTWGRWSSIEKTVPHESKVHWVSDWLARDAVAWMTEQEAKGKPGIVWTANPALGQLVAKLAGRPYYGQGDEAALGIDAEMGNRSIVASIQAHHRGRNLQFAFSANLVMQFPSSADITEQMIGRTHRSKQKANEVTVDVYLHVPEMESAFNVAFNRARYANGTIFAPQKLLEAELQWIVAP